MIIREAPLSSVSKRRLLVGQKTMLGKGFVVLHHRFFISVACDCRNSLPL